LELTRSSGVLLHITSLPGGHGIGALGQDARRFADFLADAGQSVWQILPLVPTGFGNSPYQGLSVFAGNPLMIDLDDLLKWGLLVTSDLSPVSYWPEQKVDYVSATTFKVPLLRKAAREFQRSADISERTLYHDFCRLQAGWLDPFALFMAARSYYPVSSWKEWPRDLARRAPEALEKHARELADQVEYHRFCQYVFFRQWAGFKSYCSGKGLRIMGDIPIYVALDSADTWQFPEMFCLDADGSPTLVGGVPPDYFSRDGQLWGNPLCSWDSMESNGYQWWVDRLRAARELYDIVRLDHFRGFESFWEIPAGSATAREGRWVEGPGKKLFAAVESALGSIQMVAEDLGIITPEVEKLRNELGLPGMRVLQFAFGEEPIAEPYRPLSYPVNSVVYTGTHDNDTTVGWFRSLSVGNTPQERQKREDERQRVLKALGTDGREINWDLIRLAMETPAKLAMVPLQDILGLGSEARMNLPGNPGDNWMWRFRWEDLKPEMTARLRSLTSLYGRLPETVWPG
jgi:4-alpha-glucanotransferase